MSSPGIGFFINSGVIVAIISGINVYKDFEKKLLDTDRAIRILF